MTSQLKFWVYDGGSISGVSDDGIHWRPAPPADWKVDRADLLSAIDQRSLPALYKVAGPSEPPASKH